MQRIGVEILAVFLPERLRLVKLCPVSPLMKMRTVRLLYFRHCSTGTPLFMS